jgi:hypothetical protein
MQLCYGAFYILDCLYRSITLWFATGRRHQNQKLKYKVRKCEFRWFILHNCTVGLTNLCKPQRMIELLCAVLKVVTVSKHFLYHTVFCRTITSRLLNCNTETIQVTEDRKYLPRGPHVGYPCIKARA